MNPRALHFNSDVDAPLHNGKMIVGLSGWMDGGEVSTGTVEYFARQLHAQEVAEIDAEDFYIYSFPGSMEISGFLRPHARIEDGEVKSFEEPKNRFYCCPEQNLVLFNGREPNVHWKTFAECIFQVAERYAVREIYILGSVSALVPHTRGPIFWSSSSDPGQRMMMEAHELSPTNYEGPASFGTYLLTVAKERDIRMSTLVAAIPGYIDGKNAHSMEAAAQKLLDITGLEVDMDELRASSREFMDSAKKVLQHNPDLAKRVTKMEELYDNEVSLEDASEDVMEDIAEDGDDDLRDWFGRQDLTTD